MRESAMRRLTALLFVVLTSAALHGATATAADAPAQRFVIFFQEWSAAFDDPALGAISQAAAYAQAHPGSHVHVVGFADPTGSKQANVLMSELRAQVVSDQLVLDGVPARRIEQVGRGSVQFALTGQESRRVEIAVGGR
jgi:outer membrane protein OmpA-like peptidoglycan-associated protein